MSRDEILKAWESGAAEFNAHHFWHAHEEWERGWKDLPAPEKTHVQALIQAAGAFHLQREKNRMEAAHRLARAALDKRVGLRASGAMDGVFPRLEVSGLDEVLTRMLFPGNPDLSGLQAKLVYGRG